ncbi:MAG TPA: trypsin-like peptidase domain-containing protein [Planctomycetota bacterium]|nr:trypsin-like peptidase domain-containing protein [Planctomycetota bacterium]
MSRLLAWCLLLAATCAPAGAAEQEADPRLVSKAFRAAVARVLPSLVTIESYGGVAPRPPAPKAKGAPRPRRRIGTISKPGEGPTTGLILSSDGSIVTSTFNFLRQPPIITVVLQDGSRHVAKLCGRDETRGLCLLKVEGVKDLPVPALAPRGELKVGQWVVSMGVGYGGDAPALSAGILSALERFSGKAVQTDANLSPANYGGPLVDIEGRVVGICVPLAPGGGAAGQGVQWYDSGIGFAVPLSDAEPILARLRAGEVIRPGRLGIQPQPGSAPGGGVVVRDVLKGSPARKAGIEAKDVILAIGDKPVRDLLALRVLLGRHVAGDTVSVRFKRGDKEQTVPVTLEAGDEQIPQPTPLVPGHHPPAPKQP